MINLCSIGTCDREVSAKGMCKPHYMKAYRSEKRTECSHEGCERGAESRGLCHMHYKRVWKRGELPPKEYRRFVDKHGYIYVGLPVGHPLRTNAGCTGEHRLVLFNSIGYGPHRCHWCGTHINWRNGLHADHVNAVRTDNRPENIVQSCNACNVDRSNQGREKSNYARPRNEDGQFVKAEDRHARLRILAGNRPTPGHKH